MIKFWCEEMKKKYATHIINIQNHFPICKYENKHMTQEVYPCMNALCYHLGRRADGLLYESVRLPTTSFSRQWPAPRTATVVILAL